MLPISIQSLALDIERIAYEPQLAGIMREYISSIETMQDVVRPLNLQANFAFRDIVKEVRVCLRVFCAECHIHY